MTDVPAVAIVGASGRFPGARDLDEFWANLRAGTCSIQDFGADELRASGVAADELSRPDYVPAKGYLADADRFEPELFGFTASEARVLDPQHRLLLEVAWSALEDAGYDPRQVPGRTGVYVGGSASEHAVAAYADRGLAGDIGDMQLRILTDREFLAPWISYRLGLSGPSVTVQTACATSLTAVHVATQALLLGECDTALAGGVCVDTVAKRGYRYQEGGILSPDGRCRPFDANAAGTVGGNGVGVVVLRRLADALADADPIRAVILGSAVTNDGAAKLGFTAPSVQRQTAAITEAWAAAGHTPAEAQYLELHGTGTALGDPVELAAVAAAVGERSGPPCGIGSVKSNLGHLDAAAGVASLIKVVLMLGHRTLVPTANVGHPHPDLAAADPPRFHLVNWVTAWDPPARGPRLAGVSAVGIGGTNVHVVLSEAPPVPVPGSRPDRLELVPVSARTEPQLRMVAGRLAAALRAPDAPDLADAAYTLRVGRAQLAARAYVVAGTAAQAADALAAVAAGRRPAAAPTDLDAAGSAWAAGTDIAWPQPAAGARRVHLPTYPFAGDRYGAFTLPAPSTPAVAGTSGDGGGGGGRPTGRLTEAVALNLLTTSLGQPRPASLDRSYVAAGGDSLAAIHLAGRLRDDFGVDAPIELFLEPLPLTELAARIVAIAEEADGQLLTSLLEELQADAGR